MVIQCVVIQQRLIVVEWLFSGVVIQLVWLFSSVVIQ